MRVGMTFKYVSAERDRHGATRYRFRAPWKRCVMVERDPTTPAFRVEYDRLIDAEAQSGAAADRVSPGSLAWLWGQYRASPAWAALRESTRRQRSNVMTRVVAKHGHRDAATLPAKAARTLRNEFGQNGLKVLRAMYAWALEEQDEITNNPFVGVKSIRPKSEGFKPWTIDQIKQYTKRYPIGTREYLVIMLLLFTGLRRGDVVRVGPQHVKDGWFRIEPEKPGPVAEAPIMPPLARAIASTTTGIRTFIVGDKGGPLKKESFGNWFRESINNAGLPSDISAHGVRKALAELLAEIGCTDMQIAAIISHTTTRTTGIYTRNADRKRLAADAMKKMEGFRL